MRLKRSQRRASKQLTALLTKQHISILAGEPRSGKTLAFLDVAKRNYRRVLIVTKKNALPGIRKQAATYGVEATITNFHQVKNLLKQKFDLVIIDEFHRYIGSFPKRSPLWRDLKPFCVSADMIFSSGTPTPETYSNLFNALALSDHSPWKGYRSFTAWFGDYGRPYSIKVRTFTVQRYDRTKEMKIENDINPITVSITRGESGHKFDAEDVIVDVPLSQKQKRVLRQLERKKYAFGGDLMADDPAKYLIKAHQISGGFVNGEESLYEFANKPKIDYIHRHFDPDKTIILAQYVAEQEYLASIFPHVGSITKNAEGVDYSHFENMVIYSMSFSASVYEQVRVRQLNMVTRNTPVLVTFLLSGIDHYVYKAVRQKKNFTARWYKDATRKCNPN